MLSVYAVAVACWCCICCCCCCYALCSSFPIRLSLHSSLVHSSPSVCPFPALRVPSFTSGSEDGYIRMHHLPASYLVADEYSELSSIPEIEVRPANLRGGTLLPCSCVDVGLALATLCASGRSRGSPSLSHPTPVSRFCLPFCFAPTPCCSCFGDCKRACVGAQHGLRCRGRFRRRWR